MQITANKEPGEEAKIAGETNSGWRIKLWGRCAPFVPRS